MKLTFAEIKELSEEYATHGNEVDTEVSQLLEAIAGVDEENMMSTDGAFELVFQLQMGDKTEVIPRAAQKVYQLLFSNGLD